LARPVSTSVIVSVLPQMAHSQVRRFLVAPAAKSIFNRQLEEVCSILTMRAKIAEADLRSSKYGHGAGFEIEYWSRSIYFRSCAILNSGSETRKSMLVPSPPHFGI
jgi:hypothetical protein